MEIEPEEALLAAYRRERGPRDHQRHALREKLLRSVTVKERRRKRRRLVVAFGGLAAASVTLMLVTRQAGQGALSHDAGLFSSMFGQSERFGHSSARNLAPPARSAPPRGVNTPNPTTATALPVPDPVLTIPPATSASHEQLEPLAPLPKNPPKVRRPKRKAHHPPSAEELGREVAYLRDVEEALKAGAPSRALRLLKSYRRLFPRGALRPEARGLALLAHCEQDPSKSNRRRARKYLVKHRSSLLGRRVQKACELEDP